MRQVQNGDDRAREELIERYMPLARSLALRYRRASEPLDDLIQVASVGLVKAVDRWDPERGLAFSSYAVPTILGELRRYFRDSTWDVRPARDLQELCLALEEAREKLWGELGRQPTVADLADAAGAPARGDRRGAAGDRGPLHPLARRARARRGERLRVRRRPDRHRRRGVRPRRGRRDARAPDRHPRRPRAGDPAPALPEDLLQSEIAEVVGCSQMHVSRIIRSSLEKLYAYGSGMQVAE